MSGFFSVLSREIRLSLRGGGEVLTLVLFFVIVGAVVPFAVRPDKALLA
ncbi:heme exporter protein CcmB, partial [Devosia sp.]|nr:heme exporter protein CcmB [Devosia sp.]